MSTNIFKSVEDGLGVDDLKKIDPNTAQPADNGKIEDRLNQAAIPATLLGLYKYTRSDAGAENIITSSITNDWVTEIFGDKTNDVIYKVAEYANLNNTIVEERLKLVAMHAVGIIKNENPPNAQAVKDMMAAERHHILVHLPPALHLGDQVDDNTVDDSVHKMEGPVSNFITKIGNLFSGSERGRND